MKLLKEMQVSLAAQAPLVVQPAPAPKPSFQEVTWCATPFPNLTVRIPGRRDWSIPGKCFK
jgi:hypothetical protein